MNTTPPLGPVSPMLHLAAAHVPRAALDTGAWVGILIVAGAVVVVVVVVDEVDVEDEEEDVDEDEFVAAATTVFT
jgi:hypothetical protein